MIKLLLAEWRELQRQRAYLKFRRNMHKALLDMGYICNGKRK